MVSKKLITFFVTIGMALLLRNYWALAIGIITGQVLSVALSYAMHSYRPKFSLQAIRDIWSFSQWMLVTNIGDYAYNKADEFIVGGMIGTKNLGVYTVSSEIANLPTTELVFPISRALFPGFAKLTDDLQRLSAAYLNVLGFIALFAIAAGVGVLSVASDFVLVVLGSNWVDAIPVIQWLAVFGLIRAVYGQAGSVFLALGHVRALALLIWLQVILLIIFVYFGSLSGGIVGAAVGKVSVAVIFATILFYALMRIIPLTLSNISSRLWRPILASLVMAFTINFFHNSIFTSPPLSLLHDIIIGTLVYIAAILTLWHISGRPKGAEQFLFDFVINKFNRKDLKCPKQNQKSP
jgi:O-antigen/teichoic acid export membrane protein